jgi:hypothetical protein
MNVADMLQLVISAAGIVITLVIVFGSSKRLEGSIEERLKIGDKKFDSIDIQCKNHGNILKELEVNLAVNDKQQVQNTKDIGDIKSQVDCIEGRVTILEVKKEHNGSKLKN